MAVAKALATKKRTSRTKAGAKKKVVGEKVYGDGGAWTIQFGELTRKRGRPAKTEHLFKVVGEKIPFVALSDIKAHLTKAKYPSQGIYIAHDSMGCPRYIGRGNIFARLEACHRAQPHELAYFSFYVMLDKQHEREVETLLIRAASFLLEFNSRKKRIGIAAGDIHDYEAGTGFYERQRKKGAVKRASGKGMTEGVTG